jgi:excisionase family DNA binding protein
MQTRDVRQKTLLKPREASEHFNVPLRNIYDWYGSGRIEGVKVTGRCLRIYKDSLQALLCAQPGKAGEGM